MTQIPDSIADSRGRRGISDLGRPGLALVDLQRLFCEPDSPAVLPGWADAEANLRRLADAFVRAGRPVLFTRHVHSPSDDGGVMSRFFDRLMRADDPLTRLSPALESYWSRATIVEKERFSIFSAPEPGDIFASCDCVVIAGVQTPLCVLASAIDAARLDLVPIVVADATAARSPEEHTAALSSLAAGHAHVATTDEVLSAFEGDA